MSIGMEPAYGWGGPDPIIIQAYNRTGSTVYKGNVAVLDLDNNDADTDNNNIGAKECGFANMTLVLTAFGVKMGVLGLAMGTMANDAYGKWMLRGIGIARVATSSTTSDDSGGSGQCLWPVNQKLYLDVVGSAVSIAPNAGLGARSPAYLLEDTSASMALEVEEEVKVMFDGINFYRHYAAS